MATTVQLTRRTVLLGAGALAVSACSAGSMSEAGRNDPDTLVIGFTSSPVNLDFTTTAGAAIPQVLCDNVYEGLVTMDAHGRYLPKLATTWRVSPDRKSYEFTLRQGVRFSNGSPFDAKAVKFSLERVATKWAVPEAKYMSVVERVDVLGSHKVRVLLAHPSNQFLFRLTTRVGMMFSPDGVADLANRPVGTGPYKVGAFNRAQSVQLNRIEGYWGSEPAMKTVIFRYFADSTAMSNALLGGSLSIMGAVPAPESLSRFRGNPHFKIIEGTTNGEVVLSMNNRSKALSDKRVRRAIMMGIDRRGLIDTAMSGYGKPIGSMVPPTDPWYEDLTGVNPYDPDEARRLLKQAGHSRLQLRLRLPSSAYAVAAGQVVKSQLSKIGVDAKIDVLEFPARWLDVVLKQHDFDMSIIEHVEPRDIATFADPTYYWGYNSPQVQKLITDADIGAPNQQVPLMRQAAKLIAQDNAAGFLFLFPNLAVQQSNLVGVPVNQVGESYDVTRIRRVKSEG